jgi:tripartite-type tricarboxylate transporter receptor subunit TctC
MKARMSLRFLIVLLAVSTCGIPAVYAGEAYPDRPIRIIQGFSAGGISDTLARIIGEKVEERLGQPIVVETKSGAGGIVGMTAVHDATPDGYTLLLGNSAITISPSRTQKPTFDPIKAFVPVSMIGTAPSILLANPTLPVSSVKELVEYAKARPGKLNCATSGVGTSNDLAVHLLNYMTHIKLTNVPYKGSGPSLLAAISHETPLSFAPVLPSIRLIAQGQLKPLGVSSLKRNKALPDVPAIAESVPGYEDVGFYSIIAPRGVPEPILAVLHKEFNAALALPEVQKRMDSLGLDIAIMSRPQFAKFISEDAQKWKALVMNAHLVL